MTLAQLSKKYGIHPNMISTWKHTVIANMASGFQKGRSDETRAYEAEVDKLHSKIGQLVVERDFLATTLYQLLGTRPSRDLAFGKALPRSGTEIGEP